MAAQHNAKLWPNVVVVVVPLFITATIIRIRSVNWQQQRFCFSLNYLSGGGSAIRTLSCIIKSILPNEKDNGDDDVWLFVCSFRNAICIFMEYKYT